MVRKDFLRGVAQIDPFYLSDAQSNIFCTMDEIYPFSSHSLVVGKIYEFKTFWRKDPLIYQDGDYE